MEVVELDGVHPIYISTIALYSTATLTIPLHAL